MFMGKSLEILASKIKQERRLLGISQEELSSLAGLGHTHIGRIERLEHDPKTGTIDKIARALKVEPYTLLK